MVYLYAGLGVVMLTGIMAIFEMGLSLTGQSMLPTPPDEYLENAEMKVADKRILEILTDRDVFDGEIAGVPLCTELLEAHEDKYDKDLLWRMDDRMPISEGYWARSCSLNRGSHRVLVKPVDRGNILTPYKLFSCSLNNGEDRCSFEQE